MSKIDPFELPEDLEESGGDPECPSCGVIPSLDGPTPGCNDPVGCGVGRDSDPELEDDDDKLDDEDDDPWEDYDDEEWEDDEDVEELDFEE
jgi:hypothetical protein